MDYQTSPSTVTLTPRFGRHGPRSKNGCTTCRTRKLKCPEQKPVCERCIQARLNCEWDQPARPRRKSAIKPTEPEQSRPTTKLLPRSASSEQHEPEESPKNDVVPRTNQSFEDEEAESTERMEKGVWKKHHNYERTHILSPSLDDSHIPLSNSLVLNRTDMECFQHVPDSILVLQFGKPWEWSMLSYVHSVIASQEKGVMRAFMAVTAMELRSRDLVALRDSTSISERDKRAEELHSSASNHYHRALKDLSLLLKRASEPTATDHDLDALFALWLLILQFGLYNPDLIGTPQVHLNGIQSFLEKIKQNSKSNHRTELPPASQQLLLFISYLDVNFALSTCGSGQLISSMLAEPSTSLIAHDRIFQGARVCLPKIWGSAYPPSEYLDDLENYRGLLFLQECQKLKITIRKIGASALLGDMDKREVEAVWQQIEDLGKNFYDILSFAKAVPNSGGRRVVWTVYHAALDYHAIKVFYSYLDSLDLHPSWLEPTLADILSIAYKAVEENSRQSYRFLWPLSMAWLKTRDRIHRDWIQAQIGKARTLFTGTGVPLQILEQGQSPEALLFEDASSSVVDLFSPLPIPLSST